MLPKPLYETLPYLYFAVGSGIWLTGDSLLEVGAGALLFFAGAQQWILRSNYRRPDRIRANMINGHSKLAEKELKHSTYPSWVYELLPFVYIALGYQLANLFNNPQWLQAISLDGVFTLSASLCLMVCGYLILILRAQNRLGSRSVKTPTRHSGGSHA